jgi:hypothetical protein
MTGWEFGYEGYDPADEGRREALCTLGNGYFATRGAAPESRADSVHNPGTYAGGCYNRLRDEIAGHVVVNESLVNLANWLMLTFAVDDGAWFSADRTEVLGYVSKQADVLMLFYRLSAEELRELLQRLGYDLTRDTISRTIEYYLARTSHGSTLSALVHAWVLGRANRDHALEHSPDCSGGDTADIQGGTTAEGVHLAAMAGSVDVLQRRFTGLETRGNMLRFNPRGPSNSARSSSPCTTANTTCWCGSTAPGYASVPSRGRLGRSKLRAGDSCASSVRGKRPTSPLRTIRACLRIRADDEHRASCVGNAGPRGGPDHVGLVGATQHVAVVGAADYQQLSAARGHLQHAGRGSW